MGGMPGTESAGKRAEFYRRYSMEKRDRYEKIYVTLHLRQRAGCSVAHKTDSSMNEYPTIAGTSGTLYLRLSADSLCLARYERGREPRFEFAACRVRPQASLSVNLREACRTEPLLQQAASGCVNVLVVGAVTTVPLAEFQEEDCERIYDYCFPVGRRRRVFYDMLPASNVALLFALDEDICRTVEDAFPNVRYVSAQTAVLRHFAEKGLAVGQKRVFVHLHERTADVAIYEDHRLLMLNTYAAAEAVDVAYYTLNVAQNTGADSTATPIYVAGAAALRDAAVAELRKYAGNVCPVNPTAEFNRHIAAVTPGVPYDLTALLTD